MPSLSLGLGLHKNRVFVAGGGGVPFSPTDLSGLSLWLKADAGVSTTPEQYISQIIISGAGTTTSNGTYTRASGGPTTFNGPNGNYIYNTGGGQWALFDTQLYDPDNQDYGSDSYYADYTDFGNWYISGANLGESPAPSGTTTNSPTGINLVTAWADQSGNGNDAISQDAPALTTVSGKTFVDFAGGYFTGNEVITSPYATIMCVARFSAQLDVSIMFEQFSNDFGGNMSIYWGFNLNNGFRLYNGQDLNSSSLTNNNQTYLFGATFNNDTGTLYLNSSQDASGYCGQLTPAGNYLIGRWPDDWRTAYTMKMAEIVVYNRVLTNTERQQVEAYLNAKYAIY